MAYEYQKITQEDTQGKGVTGLPDTPGLSTGDMQAKFDELSNVIIEKHNELIDDLNDHVGTAIQSATVTDIRISEDDTLQVSEDGGETYKELSSAGHVILNGSGIASVQRSKMQFSSNVVITDDAEHERTFIQIPSGQKGDKGDAATITVGNVQAGESASVTNSGSTSDAIFNFTLPKGDQGDAATIQVGTVTTGDSASVSNRGTSEAAIFDFVLPRGEKGDVGQGINVLGEYANLAALQAAHPTGNPGNAYMVGTTNPKDLYIWDTGTSAWKNQGQLQGVKGDTGNAATITIGTVTTGATSAVENVGTSEAAVFNFTLEKGEQGVQGPAATIAVGAVTKGDNASVTNVGTTSAAVFDFVLPKGDQGEHGDPAIVNGKSGSSITITPDDMSMEGYVKASEEASIVYTDSLNEAIGKLEYKADRVEKYEPVADQYDEEREWVVGEYCIHNSTVYKCNTNTTGEFDSTAWDATSCGAELTALNSDLTQLISVESDNNWVVLKFANGQYEAYRTWNAGGVISLSSYGNMFVSQSYPLGLPKNVNTVSTFQATLNFFGGGIGFPMIVDNRNSITLKTDIGFYVASATNFQPSNTRVAFTCKGTWTP